MQEDTNQKKTASYRKNSNIFSGKNFKILHVICRSFLSAILLVWAIWSFEANAGETSHLLEQSAHLASSQEVKKDNSIINIGNWTRKERKKNRPADLWKFYMHGVIDHFATPVSWDDLIGADQKKYLVTDDIETPYKISRIPAIKLTGSKRLKFPKPIPLDMEKCRNKKVRFFIWLKGRKIGLRNKGWDHPNIYLKAKDNKGKRLHYSRSEWGTGGDFPWHCYYANFFISQKVENLYLELINYGGEAYFSSLSWEVCTAENKYTINEMQDPCTGSTAYNPIYDRMTYHVSRGNYGSRYKWHFLLGRKIGMVGQKYDVTTKEGFRKYYYNVAKNNLQEMNHAVRAMRYMYDIGRSLKTLPPMEDGWRKNIGSILIQDQNPETGFWSVAGNLDLDLTFHLVHDNFSYLGLPRHDRKIRIYPQADPAQIKKIPNADKIIKTVLAMQTSYSDEHGKEHQAAWNKNFTYTRTYNKNSKEKCDLRMTWDAMDLIKRCSNYVNEDLKEKVYDSIKAAFYYALKNNVSDDGAWKQSDIDTQRSTLAFMESIISTTSWLERRVFSKLPPPEATVKKGIHDTFTFTWNFANKKQNSLRIYVVPKGIEPGKISEEYLAGIIHKTGHKIYEQDPFIAVRKIKKVGNRGKPLKLPAPKTWQGRKYVPWKLRMIKFPIPYADDLVPLTIQVYSPEDKEFYVSATTWYGEESLPVYLVSPAK